MTDSGTGFVALYRWRVDPAEEASFIQAWSELTVLIREHQGGRGSRLHRADDGTLYGYAQWPSRSGWEAPWDLPDEAEPHLAAIRGAVTERFEPLLLNPIGDLLLAD